MSHHPELCLDKTKPINGTLTDAQAAYLALGNLYMLEKNYDPEAVDCYRQCHALEPNSATWLIGMAHDHIQANEWSLAKEMLKDILEKATPEEREKNTRLCSTRPYD